MNIGIDIDGVIANFVEEFIKIVKEKYHVNISESDIIYHDLYQVLGISKLETGKLIDETLHRNLNIITDADKYINLLAENNEIYILTARNIDKNITEKWLKNHKIKFNDLIIFKEGDKNFCEKKLDVIIDDNLKEAIGFFEKCGKILIFDHPWNRSLNINNSFYRVKSWHEIYNLLSKK
jgi:uncharacterized HAD superfamily protein